MSFNRKGVEGGSPGSLGEMELSIMHWSPQWKACPANTGLLYFNFHGWFSIVLMTICSARYLYLMVTIGAIGSSSDGGIFERPGMKGAFIMDSYPYPKT